MAHDRKTANRYQFRLIDLVWWTAIAALASLFLRDFGGGGIGIIIGMLVCGQIAFAIGRHWLWFVSGAGFGAIAGAVVGFTIDFLIRS